MPFGTPVSRRDRWRRGAREHGAVRTLGACRLVAEERGGRLGQCPERPQPDSRLGDSAPAGGAGAQVFFHPGARRSIERPEEIGLEIGLLLRAGDGRFPGVHRSLWKWQLRKGPLRPREKGPPVGSVSTSTLLRHSETAHPAPPAGNPPSPTPNPEPAVPVRCGVRRSVARRVPGTLWTVGTRASRPGRKAHNCHPSRGAGGVSPEGP